MSPIEHHHNRVFGLHELVSALRVARHAFHTKRLRIVIEAFAWILRPRFPAQPLAVCRPLGERPRLIRQLAIQWIRHPALPRRRRHVQKRRNFLDVVTAPGAAPAPLQIRLTVRRARWCERRQLATFREPRLRTRPPLPFGPVFRVEDRLRRSRSRQHEDEREGAYVGSYGHTRSHFFVNSFSS